MRVISHLIIFAMVWATACAYAAGQRGISVTLRQSESVNAPILEERELYQESYALVIGIDDYDNGWPRLSNAILDAELIAEALEAKGFDVELHRNPDSEALPQIFKRFFILKGENPEARLFVWFAGHGAGGTAWRWVPIMASAAAKDHAWCFHSPGTFQTLPSALLGIFL